MQWTWTWANSREWWGTGRPGMLQSTGSQEVGHDWATEQQHHQNTSLQVIFFSSFMPSNHSPHFSQNKILKIQLWSFLSYWNFSNDLWLEVQSLKQFVSHIINQLIPYLSPFGSHTIRPIRLNSIILGNPACFFSLSSHCADYSHCEVWTKHWMKQG